MLLPSPNASNSFSEVKMHVCAHQLSLCVNSLWQTLDFISNQVTNIYFRTGLFMSGSFYSIGAQAQIALDKLTILTDIATVDTFSMFLLRP